MHRRIKPHHHRGRRFRNPFPGFKKRSVAEFVRWMFIRSKGRVLKRTVYNSLGTVASDSGRQHSHHGTFALTWIGHSTVMVQMDGVTILTDPIWSDRASPLRWFGPKRYTEPGISLDDIPRIDVVLISHDHYDHLDKATLKRLGNTPLYFVPLGVGKLLRRYGIVNYVELDWWDSAVYMGIRFLCTPAQHFSGRGVFDLNRRLWCGWAVRGRANSFFFGGDTGYFPGFDEIGRKIGPFDAALLSIGAYLPQWFMSPVHLSPAEAVKACEDLRAETLMAIHWGTFTLAEDPPALPPAELMYHMHIEGMDEHRCWVPRHGETRVLAPGIARGLFD